MLKFCFCIYITLLTQSVVYAAEKFSCIDYQGKSVSMVFTDKMNDGARAKYNASGDPIIVTHVALLTDFPPAMTAFVLNHECAHHALGHLKQKRSNHDLEQHADCWAAQQLKSRKIFDDEAFKEVKETILQVGKTDREHTSPKNRVMQLQQCLAANS
jgi:hypothetical protein